jgi:glycosyltransferase involved in cell wall biosynthesis
MEKLMTPEVAVLVPCYNEQEAIATVVNDFKKHLPGATVFVYDNASTDQTIERARAAGAVVRSEPLRGKGCVVRRMFADIDADVYVLVDGDATYDAASAPMLIEALVSESLDLVSAVRVDSSRGAYRSGHRFGNWMLTHLVSHLFGKRFSDMLSGYRVMSRRFVKSFPALSAGFEIETELTVHALQMRLPIGEFPTPYGERPAGSASKLRTISDGVRIMKMILYLLKEEQPLNFFGTVSALLLVMSLAFGIPIIVEFLHTGLVPRLPTAVLATGLMLLASLSLLCGLVLHTVTRGRIEMKRLAYLSLPIRFRREP